MLKKKPTHTANDDECIALVQRWSSALDERVTNDDARLANDNALAQIANFQCAGRASPMRPLCVTGPLATQDQLIIQLYDQLILHKYYAPHISGYSVCKFFELGFQNEPISSTIVLVISAHVKGNILFIGGVYDKVYNKPSLI